MRPDTARRQCFTDYRIAAVEWDDDYDLHTALREAKAAGAPIDKSLWDLATQISRTLERASDIIVQIGDATADAYRTADRLLNEHVNGAVCAALGGGIAAL